MASVDAFPFCGACGWYVIGANRNADAFCDACGNPFLRQWDVEALLSQVISLVPQDVQTVESSGVTAAVETVWGGTIESLDLPVHAEYEWGVGDAADQMYYGGFPNYAWPYYDPAPLDGTVYGLRVRNRWQPNFLWSTNPNPAHIVKEARAAQAGPDQLVFGIQRVGGSFLDTVGLSIRREVDDTEIGFENLGAITTSFFTASISPHFGVVPVAGESVYVTVVRGAEEFDLPPFLWGTDYDNSSTTDWSAKTYFDPAIGNVPAP